MSFRLAELENQSVPEIEDRAVDAAVVSLTKGALLVVDAQGEWAEGGADPNPDAVALSSYGADTEAFGRHGRLEIPPGRLQAVPWVVGRKFIAKFVGAKPGAVGGSFGVIKDADGQWKVDFNETVATRVRYLKDLAADPPGRESAEVLVEVI